MGGWCGRGSGWMDGWVIIFHTHSSGQRVWFGLFQKLAKLAAEALMTVDLTKRRHRGVAQTDGVGPALLDAACFGTIF